MQVLVGILAALGALALGRFFLFLGWRRHWGGRRGWGRLGPGPRRAWFLRGVFERLDATPAQEKVLLEGAAALRGDLAAARAEWEAIRGELATLLGEENLDRAKLESLLARPAEKLGAARKRLSEIIAGFHAALATTQRQRLAELVREGHLLPAHGHAYRRC